MATTEENKRQLVLNFISFLVTESLQSAPDKKESIQVAVQCLEAAFGVDYSRDFENLEATPDIFFIFNHATPPENAIAEAEQIKRMGNELMRRGMYQVAVELYTRAINLNPNNAIYFCNRAAAYSRLENHENAIADCKEAVRLNPNYAKGYSRLGTAYFSLNRFREARDAYRKALNADPGNSMYEENLKLAEERMLANPIDAEVPTDPANVDLSQLMSEPYLLNMGSQMLNNPEIRNVMTALLDMAEGRRDPNSDALLQMRRQLDQQMETINPSFADNLHRQFSEDNPDPENQGGDGDKKDEPPGPSNGGGGGTSA